MSKNKTPNKMVAHAHGPAQQSTAPRGGGPASGIFCLRAETPLHAGAGQASGMIDLPIQRESHTAWPYLAASGLKSSMRAKARSSGQADDVIIATYGSEGSGDRPGAVAISEASILLLPVRSLTGHFKWVTSPAVLMRHAALCARVGVACGYAAMPSLSNPDVAVARFTAPNGLFLEEFHFGIEAPNAGAKAIPVGVFEHVAKISGIASDDINMRMVVVHDDRFRHFAEFATPKAAHIKLTARKTVEFGPWYEETLAPDTVLALSIEGLASSASMPTEKLESTAIKSYCATQTYQFVRDIFSKRPYLRVGGNETLGMGWCKVHVVDGATP